MKYLILLFFGIFMAGTILKAQAPTVTPSPSPSPTPSVEEASEPPPITPGSEAFIYDPTGKRDPFNPESDVTTGEPTEAPAPVAGPLSLNPLENFDVLQLKVTAIIWNTKQPRAMVIDPTGNTHYIKVHTRLGKKNGFVASIREGEVVVVEFGQENGQVVKTFKVLELR